MRTDGDTLIVGAGIGGLATALALAKRGLRSTVVERAPELVEIGAGIQLAPNALSALDRLGILEGVYRDAVYPPRATLIDAVSGEELTAVEFGPEFRERYGYPYIVTHRADLHLSLLRACEASRMVAIHVDQHIIDVAESDGAAYATSSAGTTFSAELVVGADGINGVVRHYVVGDEMPRPIGDVAYRGTLPREDVLARDGLDDMTWWVGPHTHLIQYPVRQGQIMNQVAVFSSDRFGSVPAESSDWGTPDELTDRFAPMVPAVKQGIETIDKSRRWVIYDREPDAAWTRGAVTLLGDAAHPMVQYMAQGGCQALEDAVVFADALAAFGDDIPTALREYESERRPRTAMVQRWARRMGEVAHADGTMAILRNALLRSGADNYRYLDWLYGYRSPFARTVGAAR